MSTDKAAHRARFERAWKAIKQELFDYITGKGMPKDAIGWYERVSELDTKTEPSLLLLRQNLDYNVPGHELNHGMSVVDTAEIIKGTPPMDDEYLKAAVLGWSIEVVRPTFLIFPSYRSHPQTCSSKPSSSSRTT